MSAPATGAAGAGLPATMRAARFHGPGDLRVETVPVPRPGPGELLVRVVAAATNGTDAKSLRRGHPVLLPDPPCGFGHEWAGTVAALGGGVSGFAVGDRVTGANSAPCGRCRPCARGEPSRCTDLPPYLNGAYAEYLLLPARLVAANVVAVPDGMPLELAAIVQTVACCVHGAEIAGAGPGVTVAVLGLGPIGLGLVAACSARGSRVLGVGRRRTERLRLARAFGAEAAVPDLGELAALTDGEGPDVAVEAVGQPQAWSQAVAAVRRGGTVVLFGGLPRGDVPLDPYRIHYHELTLRGSYHHTPAAIREALALLAGGAYPFAELLTHTYPLERVAEPLAQAAGLADRDDRLLKAVIRP
ncbi:MAG TPA: zinc-binding dehydrogenase [Actinomycetes bacterium]|nr:zinc-binding dehydrogenase [Actinomycetes bacterium]